MSLRVLSPLTFFGIAWEGEVLGLLWMLVLFTKKILYLFIFRQRGREGHREGEKHQCLVASCMPHTWEPGPKPRHMPQLGIEPAILWFTGQWSIHWATPARANISVWLPLTWPPLGTWPATQTCDQTRNRTGDALVRSPDSIHRATPARAK